jgi:hypothetical protein
MAISEDPNLEESIHFFRPQPDDLYIYITDIYVIALFASQQLVLLRAGAQSHKQIHIPVKTMVSSFYLYRIPFGVHFTRVI